MKRYKKKDFIVEIPKVKSIRKQVNSVLEYKCNSLSNLMIQHRKIIINAILFIICLSISTITYFYTWDNFELKGYQFFFLFITSILTFAIGISVCAPNIISSIITCIEERKKLQGFEYDLDYLDDLIYLNKLFNYTNVNILGMQINKDKKEISIDYVTEGNSICKSETLFSNSDINIRVESCIDINKAIVKFNVEKRKIMITKSY